MKFMEPNFKEEDIVCYVGKKTTTLLRPHSEVQFQ
jgi:hypothetical protein